MPFNNILADFLSALVCNFVVEGGWLWFTSLWWWFFEQDHHRCCRGVASFGIILHHGIPPVTLFLPWGQIPHGMMQMRTLWEMNSSFLLLFVVNFSTCWQLFIINFLLSFSDPKLETCQHRAAVATHGSSSKSDLREQQKLWWCARFFAKTFQSKISKKVKLIRLPVSRIPDANPHSPIFSFQNQRRWNSRMKSSWDLRAFAAQHSAATLHECPVQPAASPS